MAVLRNLADEHHIVRYVKATNLNIDANTGKALGVMPAAFELRAAEPDISVTWREYFPGQKTQQLQAVKAGMRIGVTPKAAFASLNVGAAHTSCGKCNQKIRIVHSPKDGEPAHSSMLQVPRERGEIHALLANLASQDLIQSRDLP